MFLVIITLNGRLVTCHFQLNTLQLCLRQSHTTLLPCVQRYACNKNVVVNVNECASARARICVRVRFVRICQTASDYLY